MGDLPKQVYDFSKPPASGWSNAEKIGYLQRRVIIHSIIYYMFGTSVISDQKFDSLGRQLVDLMNSSTKEECEQSQYWYAMSTFDATTGFDIFSKLNPEDQHYLLDLAMLIMDKAGVEYQPLKVDGKGTDIKKEKVLSLMPHQQEAIDKLNSGSILCGGTGTGKSITAIAFYYTKICNGVIWEDGHTGPMLNPKPLYIITTAQKRDKKEWDSDLGYFDLTQVIILVDSWNNLHKYTDVSGAFFILDEQRISGNGQWVDSFYEIAKKNEWILLSATPGDRWTDYIPVFVANGFYKNKTAFYRRHVIFDPYVTKFPKIKGYMEKGFLEFLRRKITVLMTYEKNTIPHWNDIQMDYDKELYRKVTVDRWDPWNDIPIENISGACYLMRKAVAMTTIDGYSNHKPFTCNARALKLYQLCAEKHQKLIVFYNFDYELEAIKETIRICNEEIDLYSGECSFTVAEWNGHKHEPVPDTKRWMYLVQYAAGCEGWNCVETNAIAFFSMSYSYKQMTQAAGRIDRLNTSYRDLYYYVFQSDAPIDKAIRKALKGKKDFNESIFWSKEM